MCVHARVGASVRVVGVVTECVGVCMPARVALLIQHKPRMRNIVTSFVVPLVPTYFSTLSHKRHDFRGKAIQHEICAIFYTSFV